MLCNVCRCLHQDRPVGLEGVSEMKWTQGDFRIVTVVTIGNGLWLGTLMWLVLGVWLDVAGFIPCWIGGTVISWFLAIRRQGQAIEAREDILHDMRREEEVSAMPGDAFPNAHAEMALSELDSATRGEHGIALDLIRPQIESILRHSDGAIATAMRERGLSHEVVVLAVAKLVLDKVLPSGIHHTYRGVLSERGNYLFALYTHAVERLWAAEPDQEISAEEQISSMNDAISKVG